ncbi:hypothetical protein [Streptomyces sp. ME18-1-4]|uniref:hypothetical protein n=1 Tax=Streptomyces sp. ME18-1-4 TaxID=3028685 RepID=UPI0029B274D1|nr:hypothetical protein [Streptomyces sp. ME18-1-4]MDX3249183.1 hypothetical protein [Streptomyces sp. ME18-1-4]
MTYVVSVDTCIPQGTPEMDPLQRAGAVALIEDAFNSVRSVEGPDGVEVDLVDTIVAVHPGGAFLKVIVDAPALEFAEDSVQALVDELLERTELLADWTIERCEVELHQDLAKQSLDAADGPDAPPDDPAARKARHTETPAPESTDETHAGEAKATAVRTRMLKSADELRAFPLSTFGALDSDADGERKEGKERGEEDGEKGEIVIPAESARLAAGALVHATDILVDELFEDVQVLTQEDATVAECEGPLWHLERLPDRYALQYDARFARRFLVTTIAMTTRFTDGSFQRLSCVAEELALRFLLSETTTILELHGLLDDHVSAALDAFAANVYEEDKDHEWLYDDSPDAFDEAPAGAAPGTSPKSFRSWFTPFNEGRHIHPSAADEPEGAAQ